MGRLQPRPVPLTSSSSSSSPSPRPEKIFSEVTPKCEKCQSVVKPGEAWGLGPTEVDPGWDPAHPLTPSQEGHAPYPSTPPWSPSLPD